MRKAIGEEVARLLAAGFIVEVFHPEWLANPVLVLKKNGTWRMCVDYTDLNKACPADPFALPRIDQIIDATAGCERLSFLDAYSGYHQIKMVVKDQEKTTFITPFGAFCYVSMPFGLKSAQATCQRIRSKWWLRTRRRRRLLLPLEPSAMYLCLLGSRVPRQLASDVFRIAFISKLGAMFMRM